MHFISFFCKRFPSSLTVIGKRAFQECNLITSVDLSRCVDLSSIGDDSFCMCPLIKDIKIDNDYYHTLQLGEKGKVVVPKNQTLWTDTSEVIGNLACGDIVIPDGIFSISDNAFQYCASITSISFPNSLETVGILSFENCLSLSYLTFKSNLKTIGSKAFKFCESIISVDFSNCSNLSMIGDDAFAFCHSLKDIKINNNYFHVEELGSGKIVIIGKKGETSWTNTSTVVGCLACGDIVFPEGVTSISEHVFENSPLISVTFPSSLLTIEEDAFYNCRVLTHITWNGLTEEPTIGTFAFGNGASKGYVKSTGSYTSEQLLTLLKQKGLSYDWKIDTN